MLGQVDLAHTPAAEQAREAVRIREQRPGRDAEPGPVSGHAAAGRLSAG
jgi:hypothetical protein